MSKRDIRLYIDDILESIDAIFSYTNDISFESFVNDRKTYSATIREYIIIGEAISKCMDDLEAEFPDYSWRMIKDFRNFIVHEYFGVDAKIVWDLTTLELSELKEKMIAFQNRIQ